MVRKWVRKNNKKITNLQKSFDFGGFLWFENSLSLDQWNNIKYFFKSFEDLISSRSKIELYISIGNFELCLSTLLCVFFL